MIFGDYPEVMKQRAARNLPQFTEAESNLVKGTLDWVGINHYTTWYVTPDDGKKHPPTLFMDPAAGIKMSRKLHLFFTNFHFHLNYCVKSDPYKMNSILKCTIIQIG